MTDDNVHVHTQGIGFTGLLTIVFIVLKLCKVISWSWLWVLAPLWVSTAAVVLIAVIMMIAGLFS